MSKLLVKFGRNVKSLRAKMHLSQQVIARKTGFAVSYVSMLERGQRNPPLATIELFARALKVPPISLIS